MEILLAIISTTSLLIGLYNLKSNFTFQNKIDKMEEKVRDNERVLQLKNQYGFFTRKRNE